MREQMMQMAGGSAAPMTGERIVKVTGSSSHLLDGDPGQEDPRYSGHALPVLLYEGWRVKDGFTFSGGVYLILEGMPTPAPRAAAQGVTAS